MRGTLLTGAAVAGLLVCSNAASAQNIYLSFGAGGNWLNPVPFDAPNPNLDVDLTFKHGFVGSAAIGFMLMPGFRLEGEISARANDVNPYDAPLSSEGIQAGQAQIFALMANGWYDFNPVGGFQPYIGGGIGVAKVHLKLETNGVNSDTDASQHVFAYQIGGGVGYALNPMLTLTADYRLFGTSEAYLPSNAGDPYGARGAFINHSVMVGARLNLGAPPPPPP